MMIEPSEFLAAVQEAGMQFFTGVPDSLLKEACSSIHDHVPGGAHIIATNEGSAVALAIGHFLATGKPALVYMQNSGLGNAVNPLTSLCSSQIYGIPMVLLIGWRGEIGADGRQVHDEPQHVMQGRITLQLLNLLEIPYRILDKETNDIRSVLAESSASALTSNGPVALVVRKGTFSPCSFQQHSSANGLPDKVEPEEFLTREEAIIKVIETLPRNVPLVATTGMTSRELFERRKAEGSGHQRDFLTVGGMGHAGQIAAGIAMALPKTPVACLDGDGAVLMHMGGLAISAKCQNLVHIVLNNGVHDSVGGQPTRARDISLGTIARACGYKVIESVVTEDDISRAVARMLASHSSSFLEIICSPGHRTNLGRPDRTPADNKADFMNFLQGNSHETF